MTKKSTKTGIATVAIVTRPLSMTSRNEKSVPAKAVKPTEGRKGAHERTPDRRGKQSVPATPLARTKRGQATATTAAPLSKARQSRSTAGSPMTTSGTIEGHPQKVSKKSICQSLLSRTEGASIEELMLATGWQAHSVRGFLSGEVRKRLGQELTRAVTEQGERRYRIANPVA